MTPLPAADLAFLTDACVEELAPLAGGRLLLTGGTGFVGKWMLESALRLQPRLRVVVPTRDPRRFRMAAPHLAEHPAVHLVAWDLQVDPPADPELRAPFDAVIHGALAHGPQLRAEHPASTARLLDLVEKVPRRLYLSSGAAQGSQPTGLAHMPEDHLGSLREDEPAHAYGLAKRDAERLWADSGRGAVVARLFAFYGPHLVLDQNYAAGNFLRDALSGGPIRVAGDGTPLRGYLYAADLARWLWALLVRGQGGTYQVGGSHPLSIRELAEAIALAGGGLPIEVAQTAQPGASPSAYVPEATRAREELGLISEIPLMEGVKRWMQWQRAVKVEAAWPA